MLEILFLSIYVDLLLCNRLLDVTCRPPYAYVFLRMQNKSGIFDIGRRTQINVEIPCCPCISEGRAR